MTSENELLPTSYRLAHLMRELDWSAESTDWHAAFYLAQVSTAVRFYKYRLAIGHVVSDDLEEELLQIQRVGVPPENVSETGESTDEDVERLKTAMWSLRTCSSEVLEATATEHFYRQHSYGDPSVHLRWFNTLMPELKDQAREFVTLLVTTRSQGVAFDIAGMCRKPGNQTNFEKVCQR
jgi:hypothetical protein